MRGSLKRCPECGRGQPIRSKGGELPEGACDICGTQLDNEALSEFARRLARFGLGANRKPLLMRQPELPDAK